EAGALRERVRHRRRRVRADQLHGRPARHGARTPARPVEDGRQPARRDATHVPGGARRCGAALRDPVEGGADREEREREAEEAAAAPRGRGPADRAGARAGGSAMTLVIASGGDKYVAAAYVVFLAL